MLRGRVPLPDRAANESGETLIELLVTVMIMAIAVVAIIAGLIALVDSSDTTNKATRSSAVAQYYAEKLQQTIDDNSGTWAYVECASDGSNGNVVKQYGPQQKGALPHIDGYRADIKSVEIIKQPWNMSQPITWEKAKPNCAPGDDLGLQRIIIEVTPISPGRNSQTAEDIVVYKRNTTCPNDAAYENPDQGPC